MLRALTISLVLVSTACSTSYVPRTPGRVALTMDTGVPTYVRDGRSYPHGLLGGGLRDAVAGNPDAERAADEYHDRLRNGLLTVIGGAVCSMAALGFAVRDGVEDEGSDDDVARNLGIALGCTALMFGGALYGASAEPYRWDAMNIFNDGPPPPPPGMYPPRSSAPRARSGNSARPRRPRVSA